MTMCCAFGCHNKTEKYKDGISFHRFPTNQELRAKWVQAVKRKNWQPSRYTKLCSIHFRESDLDRTSTQCVRVREDAVPCIFPAIPFSSVPKERRSVKRKIDQTNEDEINSSGSPSKRALKMQLEDTMSNLNLFKKKCVILSQKNRRLGKKVANLKNILKDLNEKLNISQESCNLLNSISKTSACLLQRSAMKSATPKTKQVYDDRLKAFSITLHFLSPKAYIYVRKIFNTALPHPRTLRRWYSSVDAEPGFSTEVLRVLKNNSDISTGKTICSLVLDSMSIRKHLEWDGKRFHGTVNVGIANDDDSAELATEVLVFHLVAINSSWKVPVGYFFTTSLNGDQIAGLVKQCLNLLYDAGVTVAALTCDGNAANISMANLLGCSINTKQLITSFPHPLSQEPIYFFLDPAHMLKLVRNTFGDYKVLLDINNESVQWHYITSLLELQNKEQLHLANKLTKAHVQFFKQKMKVKLAAQTLSSSVADSLKYLKENGIDGFQDSNATIRFLLNFDQLFDILNSRSIRGKYNKQALNPSNIEKASIILKECKSYILELKNKIGTPICQTPRKTGFLGFLVCIESALGMYRRYVVGDGTSTPVLKYLPLYKISQDHIERLFGYIRSRGGHNNNPTCKQFTGSFKRILLHKELEESSTGNVLVLDKSIIFKMNIDKNPVQAINSTRPEWRSIDEQLQQDIVNDVQDEEMVMFNPETSSSLVTYDIVEYIAGFIARSVGSKIICDSCTSALLSNYTPKNSLIFVKNKGGLLQPSRGVTKICELCEQIVKLRLMTSEYLRTPTLTSEMTSAVLRNCIGLNIFPDFEEHFSNPDLDTNHFVLLVKAICQKYFIIRLHHHTKVVNEQLHFKRLRQHLCKTILFLGQ